jgi:site-specific DNA-methyltransferase (adenine-specific)
MKEVIVYKRVSELKGNPKNPRKNDGAVDTVAKSIEKYGFKNPLIIDESNVVWCGNTRLKAAKKLGLEEVPCIVVKDLTPKQMEEYALLDNKTNEIAEWDLDLLSEILPELDLEDFGIDWNIPELQEEIERKDLSDNIKEKFELVIKVENEMSLEELYNEMVERGYECKISTL